MQRYSILLLALVLKGIATKNQTSLPKDFLLESDVFKNIYLFIWLCQVWLQHVRSSSLTRNQTRVPWIGSCSLSRWTTREVPGIWCLYSRSHMFLLLLVQHQAQCPTRNVCVLSHVQLFGTPWTVSFRFLCPRDYPGKNSGVQSHFLLRGSSWLRIETASFASPSLARGFFTTRPPGIPLAWDTTHTHNPL